MTSLGWLVERSSTAAPAVSYVDAAPLVEAQQRGLVLDCGERDPGQKLLVSGFRQTAPAASRTVIRRLTAFRPRDHHARVRRCHVCPASLRASTSSVAVKIVTESPIKIAPETRAAVSESPSQKTAV